MFKDALYATEKEINLKVGTSDGSGFFFCGTSTELKRDFEGVNRDLQNILKESVAFAEKNLTRMYASYPTPGKYARENYKKSGAFGSVEGYVAELRAYFRELEVAESKIVKAQARLSEFKPLSERRITDTYSSIEDKKTLIVLVEGSEPGRVWTVGEYKEFLANGRKGSKEEN